MWENKCNRKLKRETVWKLYCMASNCIYLPQWTWDSELWIQKCKLNGRFPSRLSSHHIIITATKPQNLLFTLRKSKLDGRKYKCYHLIVGNFLFYRKSTGNQTLKVPLTKFNIRTWYIGRKNPTCILFNMGAFIAFLYDRKYFHRMPNNQK